MRQTLFRGKSLINEYNQKRYPDMKEETWVYGYLVKCRGGYYILQEWGSGGYDERWEASEWVEVNPSTVGQHSELKGYEDDIVDVCIFLVSPSNPDNDQHFRGVIEFKDGKFVFKIYKYLKFDGNKSEWVNLESRHLPFYDEELDENGTYTVTYFDFAAISGNLGEFNDDNITIVGNIHDNPELLNK